MFECTNGERKMSRREMREHLFRLLFTKEFHSVAEMGEQATLYLEKYAISPEERELIRERLFQILEKISDLDKIIERVSTGWKLYRLSKVDLALLRLAIYEIQFDEDIPVAVAINEAVEIAKVFSGESGPSFINGILAKVVKEG